MAEDASAFSAIEGREAELEQLGRLFDLDAPAGLVIEGEAGIGKTTVWLAGVELARSLGHEVLLCRPAETEADLPFASLGDLLEPALAEVLPALPPPQQLALETALARVEPSDSFGRLAVSRATLAAIRHIATGRSVLLAIDDVQWLDPSSADVLEFVARRLNSLPVRLLVARRSDSEMPPPLHLARALQAERLTTMRIGPLSIGELDRLLRSRLSLALPRPRLVEVQRISGGNPFYALEIARALTRKGADPTEAITVPDSLAALIRDRLTELSIAARHAILRTSAAAQPQAQVVEEAAGGSEGLAEAVSRGIIEFEGSRLRFVHPLLGSVAYESAGPWERREAHLALAGAEGDAERRARHVRRVPVHVGVPWVVPRGRGRGRR